MWAGLDTAAISGEMLIGCHLQYLITDFRARWPVSVSSRAPCLLHMHTEAHLRSLMSDVGFVPVVTATQRRCYGI